jgi:hypothetical protein
MKRIYLFLPIAICVALFLPCKTNAQIFKGMVIVGGNLSQINGDQVYGFNRIGLNAGLGAMAPLNKKKNVLMSMEVLYNQMGAKESGDPFQYNTRLDYVSIPFLIHYEDRLGGLTFGFGLQYSALVNSKENWGLPADTIHFMDYPDMSTVKDFNKSDFSLLFDVRFRIWERLKFNVRYQITCPRMPIRSNVRYFNGLPLTNSDYYSWTRNFYNSSLSFRLIYVINERLSTELDRNIKRDIY